MSTKPLPAAIPPVLARPTREAPANPSGLNWICIGSFLIGILGLAVLGIECIALMATIIGPNVSPPSTRIAPLVQLDQARQTEIQAIRSQFFAPSAAAAVGLGVKLLALIIGALAAFAPWDWGRRTLSWTFRLGGIFLLLWMIPFSLEKAYEIPTFSKYHRLEQDIAAKNSLLRSGSPLTDAMYPVIAYGWMALVLLFTVAEVAGFYFAWRYLESDATIAFYENLIAAESEVVIAERAGES